VVWKALGLTFKVTASARDLSKENLVHQDTAQYPVQCQCAGPRPAVQEAAGLQNPLLSWPTTSVESGWSHTLLVLMKKLLTPAAFLRAPVRRAAWAASERRVGGLGAQVRAVGRAAPGQDCPPALVGAGSQC
jgi:hypothetical protein